MESLAKQKLEEKLSINLAVLVCRLRGHVYRDCVI